MQMHTDKQNSISIIDHDYDQYDIRIEVGSKPMSLHASYTPSTATAGIVDKMAPQRLLD